MNAVLRAAGVPGAVILATALAVAAGPGLPPSLAGLTILGPYVALFAAAALALLFNRGRVLLVAVSMFAACAGYRYALDLGGFAARATYTAMAVLVPANALAALIAPERGVSSPCNYRWLLLGSAEILIVVWIASAGRSSLSGMAWVGVFDHWLLYSPPAPLAGRIVFAAAFAAAVWRAYPAPATPPRALDAGLAGSLAAFFIAAEWARSPGAFAAFMTAAGVVLLAAMLQESYRLAFDDELTGLPGRRSLEERLPALGEVCAIAMVDIDHFKKFNDAYGHDIGDQVLKLVATHLAAVEGGGKAYRYGGEEFCMIFEDCTAAEALPHLENVRAAIEAYRMAVRSEARPKDALAGSSLRGDAQPQKVVSVTVSIGVAQRNSPADKPRAIVKAADEALYRAKKSGRNRVLR